MLKQILTAATLVGALTVSMADPAQAYHKHNEAENNPWFQAGQFEPSPQYKYMSRSNEMRPIILSQTIKRRIKNDTIPLRKLFGLGKKYNGYRVNAVLVKIKPKRNKGKLKLLVNGRKVDQQHTRSERWIHLKLDDNRTLGRDVQNLKLAVNGRVYIESIKVRMSKPVYRNVGYRSKTPLEKELRLFLEALRLRF